MNAMIEMLEGREMFSVSVAGESALVTVDQPVDGSGGTVQTADLHITKVVDKASPNLMLACADGERILSH